MKIAAKFLLAVSTGFAASAPIAMIPLSSVGAAEECLTTPKDETPPGKHWYYRSERGTQRHCWYLREEGETPSQAATSTPARRAVPAVAPDRETTLARSAADAHAELPLPKHLVEAYPTTPATSVDPRDGEPKLSKNASPETAQPPAASWRSEPTGAFSSGTEPISPSFVVGSPAPDTNPDASADMAMTPNTAPVAPTKLEASSIETPASLRMLLLGTFGAIAVLWLTGRAIMARMRRRPQRPPKWPTEQPTNREGISPSLKPMPVKSTRRLDAGRDAGSQSFDRQRSGLGDNAREIEQLLARFANQAQAEP